jgi:hypothetical protein
VHVHGCFIRSPKGRTGTGKSDEQEACLPARSGPPLGLRESKGNAQSRRESDSPRVTCAYQRIRDLGPFPYKSQSAHSNPIRGTWVNNNNLIIN